MYLDNISQYVAIGSMFDEDKKHIGNTVLAPFF